GVSESFDAGDVELTTLSGIAQWHFTGGSRFAPSVGARVVDVSGDAETTEDPTDPTAPTSNVDLESETSVIVNAGLDIRMSPKVSLALDVRYFSYDANEEGDPDAESLGLDTFVYSAGVKFRFSSASSVPGQCIRWPDTGTAACAPSPTRSRDCVSLHSHFLDC